MSILPTIVAVEDAAGERLDAARPDGTRGPIMLRAPAALSGSSAADGGLSRVSLVIDQSQFGAALLDVILASPGMLDLLAKTMPAEGELHAVAPAHEVAAAGEVVGVSPMAAWLLDETSGTTAADAIGSLDGTHGGGVTVDETGVVGKAALYTGGSGELATDLGADVLPFDGDDPFSVCGWIKTSLADGFLASHYDGSASIGWVVSLNSLGTGRPQLQLNSGGSGAIVVQAASTGVGDGTWHHVAATYDGSGDAAGVAIYVDGSAVALDVGSDDLAGTIVASGQRGAIGGIYNGSDVVVPFTGTQTLDDVGIFRRELSAEQVAAIYVAGALGVSVAEWWTSGAFDPALLLPSLRWRSDTGVTESGGAISSWVDQVGAYDAIQSSEGSKPSLSGDLVAFDGTDDQLVVTGDAPLRAIFQGSYSVAVKLYCDDYLTGVDGRICAVVSSSNGSESEADNFLLNLVLLVSSNRVGVRWEHSGGTNDNFASTTATVPVGQDTYLVITVERGTTNSTLRIYIDGELADTTTMTNNSGGGNANLYLGTDPDARPIDGTIEDIEFFDYVLLPAQVEILADYFIG